MARRGQYFTHESAKRPKNSKKCQDGTKPQNLPKGVVDQTHSIARQLPGTPKHIFVTKNELFPGEVRGHQTPAPSNMLHTQKHCRKIEIFSKNWKIFENQKVEIFSHLRTRRSVQSKKFCSRRAALRALGPAGSAPRTKLCQKSRFSSFLENQEFFDKV